MNLQTTQGLISIVALFVAYCIAISVAGCFRAWVARSFGDDTAESLGLMTLNPFAHFDAIGIFLLFLWDWGWGRHVPVNPFKIYGQFRALKIITAYLSHAFAHAFLAFCAFVFLFYTFGFGGLNLAVQMVARGEFLQSAFAQVFPGASSFAISAALISIALIRLSVWLAFLSFVMSCFHLLVTFVFRHSPTYARHQNILMFLVPVGMILFFVYVIPLQTLVIKFLIFSATVLVKLFGA